jgi:hypothetical protein
VRLYSSFMAQVQPIVCAWHTVCISIQYVHYMHAYLAYTEVCKVCGMQPGTYKSIQLYMYQAYKEICTTVHTLNLYLTFTGVHVHYTTHINILKYTHLAYTGVNTYIHYMYSMYIWQPV